MIRYKCPKCGEGLAVDDGKAGGAYVCPLCDTQTTVPTPPKAHVETKAAPPALPLDTHSIAPVVGDKQLSDRQQGREQPAVALDPDSVVTPTASQTGRHPRALAVGAAVAILPLVGLGLFFAGRSTAPTAPPSKDKPRAVQPAPALPLPTPVPQQAKPQAVQPAPALPPPPQMVIPQQYPVPGNAPQAQDSQPTAIQRKSSAQAYQALDAVHDLQSAVRVGLNYAEYGHQLVEASQKIDRYKREAPAEELSAPYWRSIDTAMGCYRQASECWESKIQSASEPMFRGQYEDLLQRNWAVASESLSKADAEIGPK